MTSLAKVPPRGKRSNTRLVKIAKEIKALEKRTIEDVVDIGELLQEASEQCEHGEYQDWLKLNFGWSYQTALNMRNVFDLVTNTPSHPQKPNSWMFTSIGDLNISISALYLVAGMKTDYQQKARLAVIEAAKVGRIYYRTARDIIRQSEEHAREQTSIALNITTPEPSELLQTITLTSETPAARSPVIVPSHGEIVKSDIIDEDESDDEQFSGPLDDLLDMTVDDPRWGDVVKDIGSKELKRIIGMLQAVLAMHYADTSNTEIDSSDSAPVETSVETTKSAAEIAAEASRAKRWMN